MSFVRFLVILLASFVVSGLSAPVYAQQCPERPACKGVVVKVGLAIEGRMGGVLVSRRFTGCVAARRNCDALLKMHPEQDRTGNAR